MKTVVKAIGALLVLATVAIFNVKYNNSDEVKSWVGESELIKREFGDIKYARVLRVTKVHGGRLIDGSDLEGYTRYIIRVNGSIGSGEVTLRHKESGEMQIYSIEK